MLRPLEAQDRDWVADLIENAFGSTMVVSRGKIHHTEQLPGFIIEGMGALTYHIEGDECEIVTVNSVLEGRGVGGGADWRGQSHGA